MLDAVSRKSLLGGVETAAGRDDVSAAKHDCANGGIKAPPKLIGGQGSDAVGRVVAPCRRFQLFVDRLQQRQLHFDDVRPEEWTPGYAGNSSRVDFYLKRERTIVEAKVTCKGLDQKEVAKAG